MILVSTYMYYQSDVLTSVSERGSSASSAPTDDKTATI